MAVPPRQAFKEVIDLTGDDDNNVAPPPKPAPLPSNALANGLPRVKGSQAGGYAHAHSQPTHSHAPSSSKVEPPAKRQKLSDAPRGQVKPSGPQHVGPSRFRWYARAAVDGVTHPRVDRAKLKAEVGSTYSHWEAL